MKINIKYIVVLLICLPAFTNTYAQTKTDPLAVKIKSIISKMTLAEKIAMLHAKGQFTSAGVPRLHIPDFQCDDGPLGVREEVNLDWSPKGLTTDSAMFFPNGSALAATWNPSLAYRYGSALGEETRARHKGIILAPAFNIARTPLNGRTYEYFSEDPYLNAQLAVQSVKGIQKWNVAACIKHYALNNQETQRKFVNVEADERVLQEIYLPAFKAAVTEGNAWTTMTAYNKFRGDYCSENNYLLNDLLRKQWGFKGAVISDWGGTHSTVKAAKSGLDLEMGTLTDYHKFFFADPLLAAVKKGEVNRKLIDEKVYHILWVMYHTNLGSPKPSAKLNTLEHRKAAYDIAAESIVLLKNDQHLLPLNLSSVKSVAVIGDNAIKTFQRGGVGAGVKAKYEVTILQGLKNKLGTRVAIRYAQGYKADYNKQYPDDKKEAAHQPNAALIAESAALAKRSDLVILCIGGNRDYETEGEDRKDLRIPFGEPALVNAVLAANPHTVVVFTGGAPYDLGELKKSSPALVWSWYNGSESGNALADVLLGKINPSGKLPFTFPVSLSQSPAHALGTFPGTDTTAVYKEGLLVGYRWYDTRSVEPMYAFGYGLSYTNYAYSNLQADKRSYRPNEKITVTIKLRNTGKMNGKETVQLYVSKAKSIVMRPEKELKAFGKINVPAAGTATMRMQLNASSLAYFNDKAMKWEVEPGDYQLMAGASSRDIRLTQVIHVE